MDRNRKLVLFIVLLGVLSEASSGDLSEKDQQRILSRKKRFLVFPEGSSLQLIFDWVVPMVGMPNIFTIGITAALAWQLPHDPTAPFRRPAEVIHRRVDKPNNNTNKMTSALWYGDVVRPPSPYKYHKKYNDLLHNQYLQKYPSYYYTYKPLRYSTIVSSPAYRESLRRKQWYKQKGQQQSNEFKRPKSHYVDLVYDQVHRTTRRDLYGKLGKLLASKQEDAKACLFKVICQVNKVSANETGTFWQEILKAIFKVRSSPIDEEDEYDAAANEIRDCNEMYSSCDLFK